MRERLKKLIIDISGTSSDITDKSNLHDDLGLDSLDALELLMSCEEEFVVEILDEEVEHIKTFGDMVEFATKNIHIA
tara:strand:- start:8714 stop:8944 length:231 start_codon:yes stop_codon:yes gene_type:complete